jgi:hypothetical protein
MKLVINRKIWLRGEGSEKSYLRRGDGKQCCVGIYCSALGVPEDELTGNVDATRIQKNSTLPSWLFCTPGRMYSSRDANEAYQINDQVVLSDTPVESESERERLIAEIFARHDVQVEFVG